MRRTNISDQPAPAARPVPAVPALALPKGRALPRPSPWWVVSLGVVMFLVYWVLTRPPLELVEPPPWFRPPPLDYPFLHELAVTPADRDACAVPGGGRLFSVYILDPNSFVGDLPGLEKGKALCNISSPMVWPHNENGRGMDGSNFTEHWDYQHAVQYWLTKELKASSLVRITDDIDEADLVWVNNYCHSMWTYSHSHPFGEKNQTHPAIYLDVINRYIIESERFQRRMGSDYVMLQSHPGTMGHAAYSHQRMCGSLRNAYWMLSERQSLCPNDTEGVPHNHAVLLPYNAVTDLVLRPISSTDRPIFMYFRGGCAADWPGLYPDFSAGKLMRLFVVKGIKALPRSLTGLGKRTRVGCACDICSKSLTHAALMKQLASSIFCPVIPGDTQSSRRVSEVILNGCIPVFFGPPFHTLPLADVVDYQSFSVFFYFEGPDWILDKSDSEVNNETVLSLWKPDIHLTKYVTVHSVKEAYMYLHTMKQGDIRQLQKALAKERWKLLYSPPPGRESSVLGEEVVRKMCHRAMAVRRLPRVHTPRLPRAVKRGSRWRWTAAGGEGRGNSTNSS